ncbi:MAG: hypothetical protein R3C02_01340 [Planctomycetaceae bacterium]
MSRDLQRLIDMGTPEVIYRGHKSLIDRTILVEISVEGFDSILSGYTCGFYHYDGCIGFSCEPFDIEALKKGAKQFSERLDLCLNLSFGDVGELNLNVVPGRIRPGETNRRAFPEEVFRRF